MRLDLEFTMGERFVLKTDLLIRVDKTETIKTQYDENYVVFGCPANWIDYARKNEDGIADKYEAICGHVKNNDPRLSMICDDGIPLNMFRSLWNEEGPNDTVYVRYIYHCLTPALCFYSLLVNEDLKNKDHIITDLQEYYKSLGLIQEECSILVIHDVNRFLFELQSQIPNALYNNDKINTERFNEKNPLLAETVKYDLDLDDEFFNVRSLKDIYRKRKKYEKQKEARIVIPRANFVSDPVYNEKAYTYNKLRVNVPCLKECACLLPAINADYIICGDYKEESNDFGVGFGVNKH